MISFDIEGKRINVFPADDPDRPVVYLHTFGHVGNQVDQALREEKSPLHTLVAISGLSWDHDMAPWDCPPLSRMDKPCTGGADDYLRTLIGKIMPEAEKNVKGKPPWRGITGYSLAGLFAVYSIYQTDLFSRVGSMSGSLWFPNLKEYIFSHDWKVRPDAIYFSLGDKESKTRNRYLKTTQENTDEIEAFYAAKGIDTVFQLNPGNHYVNPVKRMASGIDWLLKRGEVC